MSDDGLYWYCAECKMKINPDPLVRLWDNPEDEHWNDEGGKQ
jgi:hypothetical protein